jgi:hypothetical protein
MKPIPYREIDLQIRRAETGFCTRAWPSPAGGVSGAWGSIFAGLEWESYLGSFFSLI